MGAAAPVPGTNIPWSAIVLNQPKAPSPYIGQQVYTSSSYNGRPAAAGQAFPGPGFAGVSVGANPVFNGGAFGAMPGPGYNSFSNGAMFNGRYGGYAGNPAAARQLFRKKK